MDLFSFTLQRNLFPPDNPLYQRLTDLMQTRDPFYKPPQPSPVDETGASTKVSPTLLTFLLVETAPLSRGGGGVVLPYMYRWTGYGFYLSVLNRVYIISGVCPKQ